MERPYFISLKKSVERTALTVDFTEMLATAETIQTAVITVTPAGLNTSGVAVIAGKLVTQLVDTGVSDEEYIALFTITTSLLQIRTVEVYVHVE